MFSKGDYVVYGNTGVCQVGEIGPLSISAAKKDTLYYQLLPIYGGGVIYTPVDTKVFMRPILTRKEVEQIICKLPDIDENAYHSNNLKLLSDQYHAAMQTHQIETLLQLMKSTYHKNQESIQNGRKPAQLDRDYRKRAEKLIFGEFAVVLGISYEEVSPYIEKRLKEQEKNF
ncbi:CarD family transcriptional regulator [Hominifimenecus sp. rT4P-3]|uniref:CarD family transcriptional regulator n=1 Tax=Hominifimenecus sp. rT4P-3 TaxID=3242979 RepID=UPI003DA38F7A